MPSWKRKPPLRVPPNSPDSTAPEAVGWMNASMPRPSKNARFGVGHARSRRACGGGRAGGGGRGGCARVCVCGAAGHVGATGAMGETGCACAFANTSDNNTDAKAPLYFIKLNLDNCIIAK